jgi:hypothetical protein
MNIMRNMYCDKETIGDINSALASNTVNVVYKAGKFVPGLGGGIAQIFDLFM